MKDLSILKEFYQQLIAYLPGGIRWYPPLPPYFTGYSYGTLYDWDQYFEAIVQLYAGFPCNYIKNGIKIFLDRQQESGLISRSVSCGEIVHPKHVAAHVKPFLAQELLLCYQAEKTLDWLLPHDYPKLVKYLEYWYHQQDVRGAGLSVWKDAGGSGMDNHHERAGTHGKEEFFCEGVDLNAYLVREARAMALVAKELGKAADADLFNDMAEKRVAAIQKHLWNEEDGIYYDFHAKERRPIKIRYIGAFAPLWAGVATQSQAKRLVQEHLLNEKEFNRPYPIPALAASETGYFEGAGQGDRPGCCSWRAHTWIPTNYYTFEGLRAYGFQQEAQALAQKTWDLFQRGPFSEYYTTESGIGTGLKPFWGWSCLALFFEPELLLEVDPTTLLIENNAIQKMREWIIQTVV